jgi:glutathione synthase
MSLTLGIVMDHIESITPYKDTTLAMMLAAQHRGWTIHVILQEDIYLQAGRVFAARRKVHVFDDNDHWFDAEDTVDAPLAENDIILMRKDPPFDMNYIYTTYLLERAAEEGVLVSNKPASLRDVNEKLYTAWFSEYCPETLVTAKADRLKAFIDEHQDAIVKPLDGMGGESIFRLTPSDPNINVVLEHMTQRDSRQIMAQRYIPEIKAGDKRVLVVNGKPVSHALARVPAQGETRGNLAAGGRGVPEPLNDHDRQLAERIGPHLVEKGLLFVGLDIIGTFLTEINVTSPTCVRELDAHKHANNSEATAGAYLRGISDDYLDALLAQRDSST